MRFPLFWLALAYAAGLRAFWDVQDSPRALFALALLALAVGLAALALRWLHATLALALAGFFLLGGATIRLDAAAVDAQRIDQVLARGELDLSEAVRLEGWLRRAPEKKLFATILEIELESAEQASGHLPVHGGLRLAYFEPPRPDPLTPPLPTLTSGERIEVLARVHEPIPHGNAGSFDWQRYWAARGVFLEGTLKDPALLTRLPGERGPAWALWFGRLREHLLRRLDRLVPPEAHPDTSAVLHAMLLGDRGLLSADVRESFRLSGAYHVLVVSGLHVGLIAWVLFWLLRRLRAPAWLAVGATIAALLFYLLLVGDRPPVERAFWMVAAYLVARLLYREVHLANPIALALLLVLWLNPSWSLQASTELTFGAVFLIAFLAVPWIQRTSEPYRRALGFLDAPERDDIRRPAHIAQFRHDLLATAELLSPLAFWTRQEQQALLRPLMVAVRASLRTYDFLVISFAIALGFVLLTAVHFNAVVATAVLANVAVVPLVAWIVPLGFAALFLALLAPPAAVPLGWAATLLVGLLLAVVGVLADFGTRLGVAYGVPPPPGWVALLYLAVLAWLAAVVQYRRRQRWPLLALAVLILVVASHPFAPKIKDDALEITVLDVGQGDAIFLAFPNGALWLIDAGRAPIEIEEGYRVGEAIGETVVTPYLRTRGLKRLDRVWLTHAHLDHLGGLEEVFEEFDVAQLDIGPGPTNQRLERLMDAARALGTRVETHTSGERLTEADVEVEILWPPAAREPAPTPSNNDSLVLRLCRRQTCALLPGDIEADVETTLAAQGAPLTAALLKVPHHGGRGSASKQFLQAVSPAVAVLSVGATNPFGHPYRDVLERLRAESERVYRTDRDGSVTVLIGDGIAVETFRQQKGGSHASLWSKLAALARRLWAG